MLHLQQSIAFNSSENMSDSNAFELERDSALQHKAERLTLKNNMGFIYKRRKESVIRFHREKEEGESKYRALLMYWPWRDEELDIKGNFETYEDHYNQVQDIAKRNEKEYTHNKDLIDEAMDDLENFGPPIHSWDLLAPGSLQEQGEQEQEGYINERNVNIFDDLGELQQKDKNSELHIRYTNEADKNLLTCEEYGLMMRQLNSKQKEVISLHRQWCKDMVAALKTGKDPPVYRIFVHGAGGTGKSHIIKLIHHDTVKLLKLSGHFEPDDVIVLLTAFTGTAAFNINGMTLHSAFLFNVNCNKGTYQTLNSEKLNTLRTRLGKLKLLIIDEISMVGGNMFYHIHRRLEEIMNHPGDTRFGNVSILAVGDLYQLQPVGQNFVFGLPSDKFARLHGSLWQENFKMIELTESMRHQSDTKFAELLNHVRTASCTEEDLLLLKSRTVDPKDPNYPRQALHVYKSNAEVDQHNLFRLSELTDIHRIKALDYRRDKQTGQLNLTAPTKASKCGGLREVINIAVNARVMLLANIDVADGLVNGACGRVVCIKMVNNRVETILVNFDDSRVGQKATTKSQYRLEYPEAVPIVRHEVTFAAYKAKSHVQMTRRQFPLNLCWACTIHKVQGKTLDVIVVSMNRQKGPFMPGQAYVALSRVKTLQGLFILDFDSTAIKANHLVEGELQRLSNKVICNKDSKFETCDQQVKILFLNVRSYKQHIPDLKASRLVQKASNLCFVETFLSPKDVLKEGDLLKNDMMILREDRDSRKGLGKGGIMVMGKNFCEMQPEQVMGIAGIEYLKAKIVEGGNTLTVVIIYKRPQTCKNIFLNALTNLLHTLKPDEPVLILGDFNIDIIKDTSAKDIISCMLQFGFTQHVSDPTTDYGSLLDHVYSNCRILNISVEVNDCYFSDHDFLCVSLNLKSAIESNF